MTTDFCIEEELASEPTEIVFSLEADEYLHLRVEQLGVDLVLELQGPPDGERLLEVDAPTGPRGSEDIFLVAETAGDFSLRIRAWSAPSEGSGFRARVQALRRADSEDRRRARAARSFSQGRFLARTELTLVDQAATYLSEAAQLWQQLEEPLRQARSLVELGRLFDRHGGYRERAADRLSQALELYRESGERKLEAKTLHQLGRVRWKLGQTREAQTLYEESLAEWRRQANPSEQATVLNDLANLYSRQGKVHTALDLYHQVLERWQSIGRRRYQATTHANLGYLYMTLGKRRLAVGQYLASLKLLEGDGDRAQRAVTLTKLGDALLHLEGSQAALEKYREALTLRRQLNDAKGEAVTLNSIGLAEVRAQRSQEALSALRTALAIFRRLADAAAEAVVLGNLGSAYERLGNLEEAATAFRRANTIAEKVGNEHAQTEALFGLARIERWQGRPQASAQQLRQVLERIEVLRRRADRPDLRSSYLAIQQEPFEFLIDLLADLEKMEPGSGHAQAAFEVSEQARARSLLDTMSAVRAELDTSVDPDLRRTLETQAARINALHLRSREAERGTSSEPVSGRASGDGEIDAELTGLLERYRQSEAELRRRHPRYAAWARPETLSLDQVQGRIVDSETLLLEYFLGESRSFLWAVTPERDALYLLPGRRQIETAALQLYWRLKQSHHQTEAVAVQLANRELSRLLLAPVAEWLDEPRRLVIVASGALQYLPFGALLDPSVGEDQPLIVAHEIVTLPSASVLAAWRRNRGLREPAAGRLAVLGDPPSDPEQPRHHLTYARQEAEAILSLAREAGSDSSLSAFGAAANKELVLSGQLADYRWLHFVTHGTFDSRHPELSSLLLSAIAPDGRQLDPHLRAYEIYRLSLAADLVVLSACETALGHEVRGEGIVGFTRAFLDAGAGGVVVSLWQVHDRSTAELMQHFYRRLLEDGLPPSHALQMAQTSMWRQPRWRAPYFWAGFVFQGDWRPRPAPGERFSERFSPGP